MAKTVELKDGTAVVIREIGAEDLEESLAFFRALPEDDRRYLRRDVTQREIVERRLADVASGRVRRPNNNYSNYLGPFPYFSRVGVYDGIFLETTEGTAMEEVVADASLDESLTRGTVAIDVAGTSRLPSVQVRVSPPTVIVARGSVSRPRCTRSQFDVHPRCGCSLVPG